MILDDIVKKKRKDLPRLKNARPLADLRAKARDAAPVPPFELKNKGVSIIAEIKRLSPSKGPLRKDLDPEALAKAYLEGGASALSVLTDEPFFGGSVDDLRKARMATILPVLRKDFIIDEYQLFETRVMLASAALLIVRILDKNQLADYLSLAKEDLGLATLVEVHTEKELNTALDCGAEIVGINNRNLEDFSVSLQTTERLRPLIPDGKTVVSESGISKREHIVMLEQLGIDAALIGERLVTSSDPAARIRELLHGDPRNPRGNPHSEQHA